LWDLQSKKGGELRRLKVTYSTALKQENKSSCERSQEYEREREKERERERERD
jgi:hypothetical protein